MQIVTLFSYFSKLRFNFLLDEIKNQLYVWNKITLFNIFLNNFFFFKNTMNKFNNVGELSFMFTNVSLYKKFVKSFFSFRKKIYKIFYFRLSLRGLGYKIKRITKRFYLFFFAVKHHFYFYIPIDVFIKVRGRRFYILCFNKMKLNNIFSQLLYLKKMDFYERTKSFFLKNKIFFLKKLK